MKHNVVKIVADEGVVIEAQAPLIVTASRATDIPAFYADWFFRRLNAGYVKWRNPFNGAYSYVSFANMSPATAADNYHTHCLHTQSETIL
jgi:hypothetical protein